jgi:hypothetical protein
MSPGGPERTRTSDLRFRKAFPSYHPIPMDVKGY